jgi:CRISPR system Cascade subunit CasE
MSWLTKFEIDERTARLQGIRDNYGWHKRLWDCFPGKPNKERDFLTRIDDLEGRFRLWLLSSDKPERPGWCRPGDYAISEIAPSFLCHKRYAFDVRVNPVKTVVQKGPNGETPLHANGKRKHGKRVPLVRHEDLHEWIRRKGRIRCRDKDTGVDIPGGFTIVEEENRPLEITPMIENHFRKKEHMGYHGGVQFRGILEVTDQERFIETYYAGIGGAKAFGFGLLLLAPVKG